MRPKNSVLISLQKVLPFITGHSFPANIMSQIFYWLLISYSTAKKNMIIFDWLLISYSTAQKNMIIFDWQLISSILHSTKNAAIVDFTNLKTYFTAQRLYWLGYYEVCMLNFMPKQFRLHPTPPVMMVIGNFFNNFYSLFSAWDCHTASQL